MRIGQICWARLRGANRRVVILEVRKTRALVAFRIGSGVTRVQTMAIADELSEADAAAAFNHRGDYQRICETAPPHPEHALRDLERMADAELARAQSSLEWNRKRDAEEQRESPLTPNAARRVAYQERKRAELARMVARVRKGFAS